MFWVVKYKKKIKITIEIHWLEVGRCGCELCTSLTGRATNVFNKMQRENEKKSRIDFKRASKGTRNNQNKHYSKIEISTCLLYNPITFLFFYAKQTSILRNKCVCERRASIAPREQTLISWHKLKEVLCRYFLHEYVCIQLKMNNERVRERERERQNKMYKISNFFFSINGWCFFYL